MQKLPVAIAAAVLALSSPAWASASFGIVVANTDITCLEQSPITNVLVASFTDVEPSPPSTFNITIDWGDGTTSAGTATQPNPSSAPNSWNVTGTHTYADEGSYSVIVTVTDVAFSVTASNSSPTAVTVNDSDQYLLSPSPATDLQATQVVPFNGPVLSFLDSNTATTAGDLTASINWGDGSPPSVGTITGSNGFFTVSGKHTYAGGRLSGNPDAPSSIYPVSVTVQEPKQTSATFGVNAVVQNELQISNEPGSLAEGAVAGFVGTVTDSDTTHVASDLTFRACFCDQGLAAICYPTTLVTGGNGTFSVYSDHVVQAEEGAPRQCLVITVFDAVTGATTFAGANASVFDATIFPSSKVIQAQPNVAWSGNAGGIFDANQFSTAADYNSVSIDWGDGSALDKGTVVPNGTPGYFGVMGTHTWASPGPFTVTVNVTDVGGSTVTVKSKATVLDTSIKVKGVTNTVPVNIPSNLTVASFSLNDLTSASTDFTAKVDWGDGSTPDDGKVLGSRGDFRVTGTHTYASSGPFTTVITVTDTRAGGGSGKGSGESDVTGGGISVDVPGSIQEYAGVAFTFNFHVDDANASDSSSTFTINVSWGDGSADTAADISAGSGGFDVSAGHTYAMVGMDTMTVTVTDAKSGQVVATVNVSVDVVEPPADGGTTGTTGGNGSSGGCGCVVGGSPSSSNLGALLFACCAVGLLAVRRRRVH
jgi:hypothetical protein